MDATVLSKHLPLSDLHTAENRRRHCSAWPRLDLVAAAAAPTLSLQAAALERLLYLHLPIETKEMTLRLVRTCDLPNIIQSYFATELNVPLL
jgi:hypothetical protein